MPFGKGKSAQGLHHITSVMHEVYDRLAELASSDSAVPGLSTGLPDVDTVISGLNKSDLILLAARPGMGKTSLALNILLYAGKALRQSLRVLLIGNEPGAAGHASAEPTSPSWTTRSSPPASSDRRRLGEGGAGRLRPEPRQIF